MLKRDVLAEDDVGCILPVVRTSELLRDPRGSRRDSIGGLAVGDGLRGVPRSRVEQIGRRAILTTEQQMRTEEFEGMRTSRAKCMGEKALGDRKARPRTSVASLAFARPFA